MDVLRIRAPPTMVVLRKSMVAEPASTQVATDFRPTCTWNAFSKNGISTVAWPLKPSPPLAGPKVIADANGAEPAEEATDGVPEPNQFRPKPSELQMTLPVLL